MPETRKRKKEEEDEQREKRELERKRKVTAEITCIFDTDDDEMIAAAASLPQGDGGSTTRPSQIIDSSSPPLQAKARPPPPKTKPDEDRPATSSDIDRIMKSIGALGPRFDSIRADLVCVDGKIGAANVEIEGLRADAVKDRGDVIRAMKEVEERIDGLADQANADREQFESKLAELGVSMSGEGAPVLPAPRTDVATRLDQEYLQARKSLHVWPLEAATVAALKKFALDFLKMTQEEFESFGVISVAACRSSPQAKISNEFLVVFGSVGDRDSFKSHAPKLQPYKRREAGIRLALPDHLLSTFKILEHEGFQIAQRRQGTKRSIKYDDRSKSLVLDIKLPGAAWVRILPEQVVVATRGRRKRERVPAVAEILRVAEEDLPVQRGVVNEDQDMFEEDLEEVELDNQ